MTYDKSRWAATQAARIRATMAGMVPPDSAGYRRHMDALRLLEKDAQRFERMARRFAEAA